jgi:ComF family protein
LLRESSVRSLRKIFQLHNSLNMHKAVHYFNDFINILFPSYCSTCNNLLYRNEKVVCSKCLHDLPETRFKSFTENPVAQMFWGRVHIEFATSFYYFRKGNKIQILLHKLKYKNRQDIGIELGKLFGLLLKKTEFINVKCIVPVPLHQSKLNKRKYNQSDIIAEGMSEVMNLPVISNAMRRNVNTDSQTFKARYDRWQNVENIFEVVKPDLLKNKHILLVDDVITTGATIEACASKLLQIEGVKVSVATLALATV